MRIRLFLACAVVLASVTAAAPAYALPRLGVDRVPLPTVQRHRPARDARFSRAFLRLPQALRFYGNALARDARSARNEQR